MPTWFAGERSAMTPDDNRPGHLVADLCERLRTEHGTLYELTGAPILEFRRRYRANAVTAWLGVLAVALAAPILATVALWSTLRLCGRLCLRPSSYGCSGKKECGSLTIAICTIVGGLIFAYT